MQINNKKWTGTVFRYSDDNGFGFHYALVIWDLAGKIWKAVAFFENDQPKTIMQRGFALHTLEATSEVALRGKFHRWVQTKIKL